MELGQRPLAKQVDPGDDDHPVDDRAQGEGVADVQDGRRVDEHDLDLARELRHDRRQRPRGHELARVGRDRAGRKHEHRVRQPRPSVLALVLLGDRDLDERLLEGHVPERDVGQPRGAGELEEPVDERPTQVEVDERDLLARLGERHGEVGDRGRLALLLEALVTMIVLALRSRFTNSRFVRSIRNGSACTPAASASITSWFWERTLRGGRGMRASSGSFRIAPIALGALHARVQRLAGEGEREPEYESEHERQDPVPERLRPTCPALSAVRTTDAFEVWSASSVWSCSSLSMRVASTGEFGDVRVRS